MCDIEIDIVELIKTNARRHGVSGEEIDKILTELDRIASEIGIEPDSLYMHLLDGISGKKPMGREGVLHQIRAMLHNSNTMKSFPAL